MAIAYNCKTYFIIGLLLTSFLISCKKEVTFTKKAKPEVIILPGDLRLQAGTIHFMKDTVYVLATNLVRNSGQDLTIDAGTLIKVRENISVEIQSGGRIEANGTEEDPVVFTSAADKGTAGRRVLTINTTDKFWYGINIYGSTGRSSGSLNFVRIEFAGGSRNLRGEAAVSLTNVDKLTTLQNIQVSYSYSTPAFNFSGGNVNASNLISYASFESDILLENGYTGMLQNVLAYRHPYLAANCPNGNCTSTLSMAGLVIRDNNTFPIISNLSVVGPDIPAGTGIKYFDTVRTEQSPFGPVTVGSRVAALLISGGKFAIRNSLLSGFPKTAFYIDNRSSAVSLNFDESQYTYSITQCNDSNRAFFLTPNIYRPNTSADFRTFILRPQYHNEQLYNFNDLGFTDPFNYDVMPDPSPKAGSPLLSGANFDGANSFFKRVAYRGAVGTGADNLAAGLDKFYPAANRL